MQKYRIDQPVILWNLTNECNLHCNYCYQNSGMSKNELTMTKKLDLINKFLDANVNGICFSGGEALLREKELCKLSKQASDNGIFTSIVTNGILLSKEKIRILKEHGIQQLRISLDSYSKQIHELHREDGWEKTLEGVFNSLEGGLETRIVGTITKKNFDQLEKYIQFGRYLGVEIELTTLIPIGRGKDMVGECLSSEQMENVLMTVAKYSSDGKGIRMNTNPEFIPFLKDYVKKKEIKSSSFGYLSLDSEIGCMAGTGWCAIQPDGLVTPCVLMPDLVAGDLKRDNFVDVWQNSELFNKLRNRDNLEGKCGDCEDKYTCGGCRARAYALTQNPLGEDPTCVVYKKEE